jgi:hypothetical protein
MKNSPFRHSQISLNRLDDEKNAFSPSSLGANVIASWLLVVST